MNTIQLSHKGETINLLAIDRHEQADIAEHFDELAEGFNAIRSLLVSALNHPDAAQAMIQKALTEAENQQDQAERWENEYRPAA